MLVQGPAADGHGRAVRRMQLRIAAGLVYSNVKIEYYGVALSIADRHKRA